MYIRNWRSPDLRKTEIKLPVTALFDLFLVIVWFITRLTKKIKRAKPQKHNEMNGNPADFKICYKYFTKFCPLPVELVNTIFRWFNSVQFSCSVVSNSLRPHGLQHNTLLCPSPTPRVYPNSCPSSRWCPSTISSSVVPFSSCLQSSQHQGLFQWVGSLHQLSKVLELQFQH